MEHGNRLAGLLAHALGVLAKGWVGRLLAARHQGAYFGLYVDFAVAAGAQGTQGLQGVLLAA